MTANSDSPDGRRDHTTIPERLRRNINAGLADLSNAGARDIVVANRTPRTDLTSQDNLNGIALNSAIAADLATLELTAEIVQFDDYSLIADMIIDPSKYGFLYTQPTDICINSPACADSRSLASEYVFWDSAHKTTRVHQILADAIVEEVPEPTSAALAIPALVGIILSRKRRQPI